MQVDTSTTRRFGGTGPRALYRARLVELMGGEYRVDSIEGEGSTFWFTRISHPLPLKKREHSEYAAPISSRPTRTGGR